jgi:hypothetical protein
MGAPRNEHSSDKDTLPEPQSLKDESLVPASNTQPLEAGADIVIEQESSGHKVNDPRLSTDGIVAEPSKNPTKVPGLSIANAISSVPILEDGATVASPVTDEPAPIGLASAVNELSQPENKTVIAATSEANGNHEAATPSVAVGQRKNSGKSRRSTGDSAKLVVGAGMKAINTAAKQVINFAFKKRGRPDKPSVAINQQSKGNASKAPPPPLPQQQKPETKPAKETKAPTAKPTTSKK